MNKWRRPILITLDRQRMAFLNLCLGYGLLFKKKTWKKKKRATKRNKVMIIHIIIKPRISFPFSRRWEEELCSCRQPRCIHSWLMFHNWEDLNWSNLQYQLFLEFPWTWIVRKWIRKHSQNVIIWDWNIPSCVSWRQVNRKC
jgi:hypothetical protein